MEKLNEFRQFLQFQSQFLHAQLHTCNKKFHASSFPSLTQKYLCIFENNFEQVSFTADVSFHAMKRSNTTIGPTNYTPSKPQALLFKISSKSINGMLAVSAQSS